MDEQDFTAQNLHNSEKGGIPGEVMIHELVHQWWGLGAMFDVSQPDSAWSAEGLTVYTTYRIIKELTEKLMPKKITLTSGKQRSMTITITFTSAIPNIWSTARRKTFGHFQPALQHAVLQ